MPDWNSNEENCSGGEADRDYEEGGKEREIEGGGRLEGGTD